MAKAYFERIYDWAECLWGRGLLPVGLGNYPDMDLGPPKVKQTVQFVPLAKDNPVWTDGARGDHRLTTAARRAGAAVSALNVTKDDQGRLKINDVGYKASGGRRPTNCAKGGNHRWYYGH